MAKEKTEFRVGKTTCMLVLVLGKILREQIKLAIIGTEHWTFHKMAEWTTHPTAVHPKPDAPPEEWEQYHYRKMQTEWEMACYIGSGACTIRSSDDSEVKLEIRCHVEKAYWFAAIGDRNNHCYVFRVWTKHPDGLVKRHAFTYWNDSGDFYANDEAIPEHPPRKIAFWRKPELPQAATAA